MNLTRIIILESKDSIIKRHPELTDDQKNELINFFKKHTTYEKIIDWNNFNKLSYDKIVDILNSAIDQSKTAKEKAVKQQGISGLKECTDYIEVESPNPEYKVYAPLNWEASKLIASKSIGGVEGKWCTAYQKDMSYWDSYTITGVLFYVIGNNTKYAIYVEDEVQIFDSKDNEIESIPNFDVNKIVNNKSLIKEIHNKIEENKEIEKQKEKERNFEIFKKSGIKVKEGSDFDLKITKNNKLFFMWRNGTWIDGEWNDGQWKNGTWLNGIWDGGVWHNGEWKNGTWHGGYWYNGTWFDGEWIKGYWKGGYIYSKKFDQIIKSMSDPNEFKEYEKYADTVNDLIKKIS